MLRSIILKINKLLIPPNPVQLGRWNLKHNNKEWQNYLNNYYGDPGYGNINKDIWIKNLKN